MSKKAQAFAVAGLILFLIIGFCSIMYGVIKEGKDRHDPLYYCLWDIHQHEDYDCEFTYFYSELEPKSEIRKEATPGCDLYVYYITVFTDERKGEWFCCIECKAYSFFKGYKPEEVIIIDCDLAFEYIVD